MLEGDLREEEEEEGEGEEKEVLKLQKAVVEVGAPELPRGRDKDQVAKPLSGRHFRSL